MPLSNTWPDQVLAELGTVNIQLDFYDAASEPEPDLANGTYTNFTIGGSSDLINTFAGSPGALKYATASIDNRVRWIFTNLEHVLPFEFELEMKDYSWPGNTLVDTFTETVRTLKTNMFQVCV
jgi:hypothetical protein